VTASNLDLDLVDLVGNAIGAGVGRRDTYDQRPSGLSIGSPRQVLPNRNPDEWNCK
jgi:hypothetical protein